MTRTISRRRRGSLERGKLPCFLCVTTFFFLMIAASSWPSLSSQSDRSRRLCGRIRPDTDADAAEAGVVACYASKPWITMVSSHSWPAAHVVPRPGSSCRRSDGGRRRGGAGGASTSSSSSSKGPARCFFGTHTRGGDHWGVSTAMCASRGDGSDPDGTRSAGNQVYSSTTVMQDETTTAGWWDRDTLMEYAQTQGVELSLTTLGPAYRGVARSTHNRTQILGYVEGFVRPHAPPLLHLDKMEVFRPVVKKVRVENPHFTGGGTPLGVGLLVAYLCVLHGHQQGCDVAEFLAIDDAELQHRRLVKLYRQSGFDVVKYVGDAWQDIPDRMVWGGCGTLLRKDVPYLLEFWTQLLEKSREAAPEGQVKVEAVV